jgi:hypothetical protein
MDADTRLADIRAREASADDVPWLLAFIKGAIDTGHYQQKLLREAQARITELESTLVERDEKIAYLIAAEPTLDDDQPGVPL